MRITDEQKVLLKSVVDHFEKEDTTVRQRQIRNWRKLKLLWEGFSRVWYSETAHDWRIYDEHEDDSDNTDQDYYNKPINVFRAYLESIIAALSVTVPPIKCYPDDADNPLDLATAKAGDKIAELVGKHNDMPLLWIHALFIYCTEGMVACYNYTKEDESYGTYNHLEYKNVGGTSKTASCPLCGAQIDEQLIADEKDEFQPDDEDINIQSMLEDGKEVCPQCLANVDPEYKEDKVIITRFVGNTTKAKARQCLEVYGGLYVKVANYAKTQKDTPYLQLSYESDFTLARNRYPDIRDKIGPGSGSSREPYERWGRTNPQYSGELPINSVTIRNNWLRPAAFEILDKEDCASLKKKFPSGAKVVMVDDQFAEVCNESLDDHWTLTSNPLSDYIYHDPLGQLLISIQEITNDLTSLILQTIEHGIGQTFADPNVLNFDAYRNMETVPGGIYPATPKSGKAIGDGFHEMRTASLSAEVLPFAGKIQEFGQLVSGALPSLFGGQSSGGSNTASEYSMSRAQALQRLQNTWKMFTIWYKNIFGKVIPQYIKCVQDQGDEKTVKQDEFGNFVNILLRKSELEGKIGSIELEANENLPMAWSQRRDILMKLLEANNQQVLAMLAQPENLHLIWEAVGIPDFYVEGEDSRARQYDEIKQLLNSEPIPQPPDPMVEEQAIASGQQPPPPTEVPSVEIDVDMDDHQIHFAICKKWAASEAGALAKIDNANGYRNVLLHAVAHKQQLTPPPPPIEQPKISYSFSGQDLADPQVREVFDKAEQLQSMPAPPIDNGSKGAPPLANPLQNKQAPITGESNVSIQ